MSRARITVVFKAAYVKYICPNCKTGIKTKWSKEMNDASYDWVCPECKRSIRMTSTIEEKIY